MRVPFEVDSQTFALEQNRILLKFRRNGMWVETHRDEAKACSYETNEFVSKHRRVGNERRHHIECNNGEILK